MRLALCVGLLLSLELADGRSARGAVVLLPTAVPGVTLPRTGGTDPATGLTFDPVRGYYYGNAANNPRVDGFVWNAGGTLLQRFKPLNVDVRALNYNPNTQAVEAITVSADGFPQGAEGPFGFLSMGRDSGGLFTGANTQILAVLPGMPIALVQTAPAYDPVRDQFYALSGSTMIFVVSRATGERVSQFQFDTAVAPLSNVYSVGYDVEREVLIAVNRVLRRAFAFDLTGAFLGFSDIPAGEPISWEWGIAYTNGQLFVTDSRDPDGNWQGYTIFAPLPEPASLGLMALGAATLLLTRRRLN